MNQKNVGLKDKGIAQNSDKKSYQLDKADDKGSRRDYEQTMKEEACAEIGKLSLLKPVRLMISKHR